MAQVCMRYSQASQSRQLPDERSQDYSSTDEPSESFMQSVSNILKLPRRYAPSGAQIHLHKEPCQKQRRASQSCCLSLLMEAHKRPRSASWSCTPSELYPKRRAQDWNSERALIGGCINSNSQEPLLDIQHSSQRQCNPGLEAQQISSRDNQMPAHHRQPKPASTEQDELEQRVQYLLSQTTDRQTHNCASVGVLPAAMGLSYISDSVMTFGEAALSSLILHFD